MSRRILHIDFQRTDLMTERVTRAPCTSRSRACPMGVKSEGGVLDFVTREVARRVPPDQIPTSSRRRQRAARRPALRGQGPAPSRRCRADRRRQPCHRLGGGGQGGGSGGACRGRAGRGRSDRARGHRSRQDRRGRGRGRGQVVPRSAPPPSGDRSGLPDRIAQ